MQDVLAAVPGLEKRFVHLDRIADLLEPARYRTLGDAFAQCGHLHCRSPGRPFGGLWRRGLLLDRLLQSPAQDIAPA